MSDPYRVLFIHQSSEMYGSDKVLLSLVTKIDHSKLHPIVLVPNEGPLVKEFQKAGVEYVIVPLVRASRATFSLRGLFSLPLTTWKSIHAINKALNGQQIDLVYSNTLAVLSGAIWAKLHGIRHLWHVHEIIKHPTFVRKGFAWMLKMMSDKIICNSEATLKHLLKDVPSLAVKAVVVWNGLHRTVPICYDRVEAVRKQLGIGSEDVLIVLMGRINRWKGQNLLVDAAHKLWCQETRNIHYLLIGSPPKGEENLLDSLKKQIDDSPMRTHITHFSYTDEIWPIWDACDIAVVPSIEPEPFGMVALEAMAARKPIIAANHGGIKEIIVNEVTGLLVEPGNATEFAAKIARLVGNRSIRKAFGEKGYHRLIQIFDLDIFINSICVHCQKTINAH